MSPESRTVLIVDDEPQLRRLLSIALTAENYNVVEAVNAAEAIDTAAKLPPDLILLDLDLPDKRGHDVLKHLREWFTKPIIIVSAHRHSEEIIKALDGGANDYLTKPFRNLELLSRIRAAIKYSVAPENSPVLGFGNVVIDFLSRRVTKANRLVNLSTIEYSLLGVFVRNQSRLLTIQYLIDHVQGSEKEKNSQFLMNTVSNLRKKIEDNPNRPIHLLTEPGVGYRFVG